MARKAKTEESDISPTFVIDPLLEQTSRIVSAFVSNTMVPVGELPGLMQKVYETLRNIRDGSADSGNVVTKPAVNPRKSVTDEYIVCLEDGKKLTMLKRYLRTHYNMSPEEYRKKWDLPHDYPMVAPAYARLRSAFAKKIGLGRVPVPRGKRKVA